ncbi:MAG TPA: DUF4956 domain-containing protein [Bacteroidia bacterium]|nr:DUF4956 domain-containing protein [Bacteroidia bacterium]
MLLKWVLPILFLLTPAQHLVAQTDAADQTSISSTEDDTDDSGKKKKKNKDKEEAETPFFAFNFDRFNAAFFVRLLIDVLSVLILIRFIYYPVYKRRDQLFTFYMFNITIFVITFLLNGKSGFSTGAAFGLFAVFSLLRYRTEDISARDMTYLFTVIALGLMTSANRGNVMEILLINSIILIAAFLLDGNILMKTEFVKSIQYENIELIKPERHTELIEDLERRMGLKIHKISIGKVDFLRDTAVIKIYYFEAKNQET